MLSMASALEKTKKTRCRVFVEVVTTSTVSTVLERLREHSLYLLIILNTFDGFQYQDISSFKLHDQPSSTNTIESMGSTFIYL